MARLWGGVLMCAVVFACSPPRQRGCYEGCLAGTVCDEPTQYCVPATGSDAGLGDAGITPQDGGVDAGPVTCATSPCPDWSECINQLCVARYTGLTVTAPTRTGGPFEVSATLELRPGATPNPPGGLELSSQGGTQSTVRLTMAPDGGRFVASVPAIAEGSWISSVTWAGPQLSGAALTRVDRSAPRFEVTIAPAPARRALDGGGSERDPADPSGVTAWRRDESGGVVVRALDSDVVPSTVQIRVGDLLLPHDGGCLSTGCSLVVDYSRPAFPAWRGALPIVIAAADDLGNSGSFDGGSVRLTRLQWRRSEPAIAGNQYVGAVALEPDGTVYLARVVAGLGELLVLEPSGELRRAQPMLVPLTAPMLGQEDAGSAVFLGVGDPFAASLIRLEENQNPIATQSGDGPFSLGPVLMLPSRQGPEAAYWGQGGGLHGISYATSSTPQPHNDGAGGSYGHFQLTARGPRLTGVLADGAARRFVEDVFSTTSTSIGQVASPADPMMGWEQPDASVIGVTGTSTTRAFWRAQSGVVTGFPADAGTGPLLPFAFRQGEAWYTTGQSLCHGAPGAAATCLTLAGGFGYGGVLTAGQKVLISGSRNGTDAVLLQIDGATMTIEWEAPLADPAVPSELQHVRCLGRGLGVAVGTTPLGEVISAVIDQPGLDSTADWANFSHDPRNTFNFSTPLAPYSCP